MKKKLFFTLIFFAISILCLSQAEKNHSDSCYTITEKDTVWKMKCIEKQPNFIGGDEALMKFVTKNFIYPETAKELNIQGTVIVEFLISATGKISDVKLYKGVVLDEQKVKKKNLDKSREAITLMNNTAIHIISIMPNWSPALLNGKPVNVRYLFPLKFKLG